MKWVETLSGKDRFFVYLSAVAILFASARIIFSTSGEEIQEMIEERSPKKILFSYKQKKEPVSFFDRSDYEVVRARVEHINQLPKQDSLKADAHQLAASRPERALKRIDFKAPFDKKTNLYKKQMADLKHQAENYHDDDNAMNMDMVRQMQRDGDMAW